MESNTDENHESASVTSELKDENPSEPLEISWRGVFFTVLLVVLMLVLFFKVVKPALIPTRHNPVDILEYEEDMR